MVDTDKEAREITPDEVIELITSGKKTYSEMVTVLLNVVSKLCLDNDIKSLCIDINGQSIDVARISWYQTHELIDNYESHPDFLIAKSRYDSLVLLQDHIVKHIIDDHPNEIIWEGTEYKRAMNASNWWHPNQYLVNGSWNQNLWYKVFCREINPLKDINNLWFRTILRPQIKINDSVKLADNNHVAKPTIAACIKALMILNSDIYYEKLKDPYASYVTSLVLKTKRFKYKEHE